MNNNDIVPGFDDEKDDSLKIRLQKIEEIPGCLVLYLTGYIDTYNSENFQKRVTKAIEAGFIKLIFHIAGTNVVSSTEIGSYTAFLKAVKPRGGDLVLLEMQPKVYEVYQLLGFSQFFNIKENFDEAVSFFAPRRGDGKGAVFPRISKCPICSRKLMASKSGRFRCSECKTILAIDNAGQVFLGGEELLKPGTDVNATTKNGGTPLIAADRRNGNQPDRPQERLMAVLSAGARGYGRLMNTDEAEAFHRLMACRNVMFELIASYKGRVTITTGDALLAEFASVEDAVAAAVAIQESLAKLNEAAPLDRRMMFGIGINHGYAIVRGSKIFGSVVNIAKGLQSVADAGEIFVTSSAVEQVRGNHDQMFVHLGAVRVKDILEPIEVYVVLPGAKPL